MRPPKLHLYSMCKMQPEQNTILRPTFIAKSKQPNLELGFLKPGLSAFG